MSLILHSKIGRDVIEEIIKKHVEECRRSYSWSGEHKAVTKDILKYLRWGKLPDYMQINKKSA
tara:strand:- start:386 stop:574 length:189 start_codon:yes stop_codon:yes gene_type:complete